MQWRKLIFFLRDDNKNGRKRLTKDDTSFRPVGVFFSFFFYLSMTTNFGNKAFCYTVYFVTSRNLNTVIFSDSTEFFFLMKRLGVFVVLYYLSFRHWRVFYSGGSLSKWALYQQCWRIYLWLHPGIYCFFRQDPMQRSVAVPWVRHLTARIPFLQSSKKCFHHLFLPDVNECTEVPGYCQNGMCTNTIGSSRCRCRMGYRMNQSGDACIGKTTLTLSVT